MYGFSANRDWHALTKYLIPFAKLQEFLDAAVRDETEELASHILELYATHFHKVEAAIAEAFEGSEFYTSDVDGDVDEVKIKSIKIEKPLVLEVHETFATISVAVKIRYVADVSYLNDEEGIWDGEDHVWSYRPTVYAEPEETEQFEAELEVEYDSDDEEAFEMSCTINKTFSVTVLPTDYELK